MYVGNLPMNANEDELRRLFFDTPGFKRLSFKMKSNGPMCFVEYEDIWYATQSMNDLYGTMLSCSTKGGIRLSYSKNPLGVRSQTSTASSTPMPSTIPIHDSVDSLTSYVHQQLSLQQPRPSSGGMPYYSGSTNTNGPLMYPNYFVSNGTIAQQGNVVFPSHQGVQASFLAPQMHIQSPPMNLEQTSSATSNDSWNQSRLAAHLQSRLNENTAANTNNHSNSGQTSFLDLFLNSNSTPGLSSHPTSPFNRMENIDGNLQSLGYSHESNMNQYSSSHDSGQFQASFSNTIPLKVTQGVPANFSNLNAYYSQIHRYDPGSRVLTEGVSGHSGMMLDVPSGHLSNGPSSIAYPSAYSGSK